ncbi:acyl-homoserine-lactone synthase [Pseudoroseicyclus sp. CXY001]|uniref:acyl-homoserine-lactone synthase n=1 Tax=Pseudoroseicyclus sp. CXY001 TaxID=3242492 RepID=UPI00358DD017
MLRFLYAHDLAAEPALEDGMFRHRAEQFVRRLGWDLALDARGWERDDYDALNPLYVIWQGEDGAHLGSARFLPTTGRTMVNEHFAHIAGGPITSPFIWECTRLCLAPGAGPEVAAALLLGGSELMRQAELQHFVGVFDQRMLRVYRGIGAMPEVLGLEARIGVGLWAYEPEARARLCARSGVTEDQVQGWYREATTGPRRSALAVAAE